MAKRKSRRRHSSPRAAVGVAWYRPQEWQRLLQVSADRDELEATYDEWASAMPARIAEIEQAGFKAHRIDVGVEDLIAWCRLRSRAVDGAARADYVAHKLKDLELSELWSEPDA